MAGRAVSRADSAHLANVLGVVALDVTTRVAGAVAAATGLSMVQATAVSALANSAEGGSIDELRHAVDLSHSAAVRMVDRLVDLGLLTRRRAADGRVAAIHLTAAGRRAVAAVRAARQEVLDGVVASVPGDQRAAVAAALDALAARDIPPAPEGVATSNYVCRLCNPDACGHPQRCPVTTAVRASID